MKLTNQQLKQIIREELQNVLELRQNPQSFSSWKNDQYKKYYSGSSPWNIVYHAAVGASYQENPEAEAQQIIAAVQKVGREAIEKDRTGFEGIIKALRTLEEAGIDTGSAYSLLKQWNK